MKKILSISSILFMLTLQAATVPDGTLDGSFGAGGKVTTILGGSNVVEAALFQPDGKIVGVGHSNASGNNDFALARYNADGTLDTSFGSAGTVTTDFGGASSDLALATLLQVDGKIIAVGRSNTSGNNDFALARYNADGTLDTSFGTAGTVTTNFSGTSSDLAEAALLQPDGKIIAVGRSNASGNNDFALARYNADGTLDTSFGTAGTVTTNFSGTSNDLAEAALLQPDGKIIAVGQSNASGDIDFALARYNADGTLDTSFGTAGTVTTNFSGTDADVANAAVLQPDGKIVVVGTTGVADDFGLARYNTDGTLDTSFGTAGLVTTNFSGDDQAWAAFVQADGKIVAGGAFSSESGFALARYLIPSVEVSQLARDMRAKYALLQ